MTPVEPHEAITAQAHDTAPDQNIGAGFSQHPRFRIGFFPIPLFRVHCARDGYGLHTLEVPQLVEQQFLVLPIIVACELHNRNGEAVS
jgi:hypothetical protein